MMRPTQAKHKAVKATAVATEVDLDMGDELLTVLAGVALRTTKPWDLLHNTYGRDFDPVRPHSRLHRRPTHRPRA